MARRHERTHSTRRLIRAGVPQGSTLSLCCTLRTQTIYRDRCRLASNCVIRGRYRALYGSRNRSTDSPSYPPEAIDELGQWFRKWRIEVNPDKSAAIHSTMVRLGVDSLSTKHPNLKMLDANIPWQRNYKYLESRSIKIYTSEIISSVLEILHFSTKQGSGPCSVEK
ncbi:hypothetical protein EVAR_16797_1 [Eumeta japonica]|uniref:Uncharacterized protein n=1 Tax=Eumeta variegata TaxID=151549 RepID=A0A4C1UMB7_EUMVA|nr:hypothetical protein EVAR_16797_1 [Eumeta japonica]